MQNCLKNEVYDPVEDKWTALMDTPSDFGHIHRTVAIIDDVAYLLGKGGYMLLISVYCCDTNKSTCYRLNIEVVGLCFTSCRSFACIFNTNIDIMGPPCL